MIFSLILLIISFSAMAAVLARRLAGIKAMSDEEVVSRAGLERPFWLDFYEAIFIPAFHFYQNEIRPFYLKEIEKMTRRFRIVALRLECLLMRFGEYIRGKRVLSSNGHKPACNASRSDAGRSHYWEQLNNCKNGIGNGNGNGDNDSEGGNASLL